MCATLLSTGARRGAMMATLACEIHHRHPKSDWTGFYRVVAPELLKIGPYQGA